MLLQFYFSCERDVTTNDLNFIVAREGGGQRQGRGASGNHEGIDHVAVLIKQLEGAAVAAGLEVEGVTVKINSRYAHRQARMATIIWCGLDRF